MSTPQFGPLRRVSRSSKRAIARTQSVALGLLFLVLSAGGVWPGITRAEEAPPRRSDSLETSISGVTAQTADSLGIRPLTRTWDLSETAELAPGRYRLGGAVRARYLDWQSIYSFGRGVETSRRLFLTRLQVSLDYRRSRTLRLFALLNNESVEFDSCDSCETGLREIIFENMYVEVLRPWRLPLAVRFGRQNLFYGDGWLVADGTPLDQSRTVYVNGLVFTSQIPSWSFDVFAVKDPRRDNYLPRINNKYTALIEVDEFAWGVLARREPSSGTALRYSFDPYYIYKRESDAGRSARIHTVGARLGFGLGNGDASIEFAYQGGRVPQLDYPEPFDLFLSGPQTISATAGQARIEARLPPPVPLEIAAGYVYLSGDNLETRNKFEGWNPLFGRWPVWSELAALTASLEGFAQPMGQTIAYWQNLAMPFLKVACGCGSPLRLEARYMWLDALQALPTMERLFDPSIAGPTHRGTIYTLRMSWSLPGLFDGHALYESFTPGDFYPNVPELGGLSIRRESASYFRLEISRSF